MSNCRGALLDHVKDLKPGQADVQLANVMLTRLLGKARGGVIRPENTPKHCKRKVLGGPTAHSKEEQDKNTKKRNPRHQLRRKAANDAENRKATVAQGLSYDMRSKEDTKLLRDQLFSSKTFPILDNMAMSAAIESNSLTIYIRTSGLQGGNSKKKTCAS
jgi:hypothetical protein